MTNTDDVSDKTQRQVIKQQKRLELKQQLEKAKKLGEEEQPHTRKAM